MTPIKKMVVNSNAAFVKAKGIVDKLREKRGEWISPEFLQISKYSRVPNRNNLLFLTSKMAIHGFKRTGKC